MQPDMPTVMLNTIRVSEHACIQDHYNVLLAEAKAGFWHDGDEQ